MELVERKHRMESHLLVYIKILNTFINKCTPNHAIFTLGSWGPQHTVKRNINTGSTFWSSPGGVFRWWWVGR